MAKKVKEVTESGIKQATIFDHLNNIYLNKPEWNDIPEMDQKTWSSFMINKWISMNLDYLPIINDFQKLTLGQLSNKEVYNIYKGFLPKAKVYAKYIKAIDSEKYNPELIDLLALYHMCSTTEALQYLEVYFKDTDNLEALVAIISKYGKSDKEIKKLITKK